MSDLRIGEVVDLLQPEFPELSISKLRFLEDKGLVTPVRTESGYRKYSHDDVVRLRYVLTAQRDQYLPLKVIRDALEAMSGEADGRESEDTAPTAPTAAVIAPAIGTGSQPDRTLPELATHLDVDISQLRRLRDNGLLSEDGPYNDAEQRIARWAVVLLRDGLEPRHLRMFVQFVDREVVLVEQMITPLLRQRNPDAGRRARLLAGDLGEAAARLHGALLSRALEDLLRG